MRVLNMKCVINKNDIVVNGGNEFELPDMTLERHEEILKELAKEKDKLTKEEYNQELQRKMIYKALHDVDSTVTPDMIKKLHPTQFIELSNAIWEAGTEDDSKFRIGEAKKDKPKTG